MRVVIDTNIIVSSFLTPSGKPAEIIDAMLDGRLSLITSAAIMQEYRSVLLRPKFKINHGKLEYFLNYLIIHSEFYKAKNPASENIPHKEDEKFVIAAVAGNADYLITGNAKHFPAGKYGKCVVISAAEFIKLILM